MFTPAAILDLFCGAGGAAMGLHRAWPEAEIVGVDLTPQPRYPFEFVQADALEFPLDGYDFIWASPPCQHYSRALNCIPGRRDAHPALIAPIRDRLQGMNGTPYIGPYGAWKVWQKWKALSLAQQLLCGLGDP